MPAAENLSPEELTQYFKGAQAELDKLALLHNQRIIQSFSLDKEELDAMGKVLGALSQEARVEYLKDIVTAYRNTQPDAQRQLNFVIKLSRMGVHQL